MNSSFEQIVKNLPIDKFGLLENFIKAPTKADIDLLKRKGFYPYSYISKLEKFNKICLPPLEKWTNSLHDNEFSITQAKMQ